MGKLVSHLLEAENVAYPRFAALYNLDDEAGTDPADVRSLAA
jgi:hypothetical protein